MLYIIITGLIIAIFVLVDKYNNIKYENQKLKTKISELTKELNNGKNDERTIEEIEKDENEKLEEIIKNYENVEVQHEKEEIVRFVDDKGNTKKEKNITPIKTKIKTEKSEKAKITDEERKNITILITGSICVILAAIVFLASTWMLIPNVLKTATLLLVTAVFLAVSNIADIEYGLKQTSKTFFYIAMAYIPICLLSISVFSLLGNYLSIYGDGKWIYFAFSTLIIAIIYYVIYKYKDNKYMLYGSVLSQIFAIISVSLVFSDNLCLIYINLLIYNILLVMLTKKELFEKIYNIIPLAITVATITLLWNKEISVSLLLALLVFNYIILYIKEEDSLFAYMYHIILAVFGAYTIYINNNILGNDLSYLLMGAYIIFIYIIETLISFKYKEEGFLNSLTIVTIIALAALHIECIFNGNIITPYMVSFWQLGILAITYIRSKNVGKDIVSILIPIYFIATGLDIISKISSSYHLYVIFSILTFVVSELLRNKNEILHKRCFEVSHIFIIGTYAIVLLTNLTSFLNDIVYSVALFGIYLYCYFIEDDYRFKYIAYILSNYVLVTFMKLFNISEEMLLYIPMITTSVIIALEHMNMYLEDEASTTYLGCMEVVSLICTWKLMELQNSPAALILSIVFVIAIIIKNIKEQKEQCNLIPLLFIMPHILVNNFSQDIKIVIILISVFALSVISEMNRQVTIYTIFSGVYLIFAAMNIENAYLKEILFICWSITHFFAITQDWKEDRDKFKFLSYLSVLILYNTITKDLGIQTYTIISMLGYIVFAIAVLKAVAANYIKDLDLIEYIVFALLYLIAFMKYNDNFDGMLFGGLLVLLVMISYIKRYGAIFMTTITAIFINVILLTRKFWLSVPWWIYLLVIGGVLISFAIKNEASEEKKKKNLVGVLKGIKESIDKK